MKVFIAMPYGNKSGTLDIDGNSESLDIPFDDVWQELIKPAIPEEWKAIRADESDESGLITEKYMQDIYESDVFIADITFNNPNVFYELGIRQVLSKKSTILVQQKGNKRPFDVKTQRVIPYNLFMGTEIPKFIDKLKKAITTAAANSSGSPVHKFLPNLHIYNSPDGDNPKETIKSLTKKIDDLSVEASTKLGSAEQFERQRALRSELTDLLSRIVRAQIDNAKLYKEHPDDPNYANIVSGAFNQENAFLLNEAVSLIDQIPDLVGSVEYNTIAYSLAHTGDLSTAQNFYIKAINATKSNIEKSMSQRSYAGFLAQKGMVTESRAMYQEAIIENVEHDNQIFSLNGFTYQSWGTTELNILGNEEEALKLFDLSQEQFESINNPTIKMQMLTNLNASRAGMQPLTNNISNDVISRFQNFFGKE